MENFVGQLGNYTFVKTEDGGPTVFSEYFGEHCHSLSGSRTETQNIYLKNSGLLEESIQNKSNLSVLEIGTGPGLALEMLLENLQEKLLNSSCTLTYVGLELDLDLFLFGLLKFPQLEKLSWSRHSQKDLDFLLGTAVGVSAMILLGDARQNLPQFISNYPQEKFNFIFQDPFSPPKNPTLWTVEWFRSLKQLSTDKTTLSTYSSSSSVRKGLIEAGWFVFAATGFGKKKSSTVAKTSGEMHPDLLEHLKNSPVQALRDL